ncbi:RGCVC family protein [Pseudonocardia humida]|uniref:RGCVC family protein n=1 Tax=Pseudonocardia humida TaxID=2800819 RepID=A0ABT0ZTG7_9PSEU|nr:RGCVC family protein [Pseudonocardia humida]MCO1654023.1 RGCVC family protein [Pseudonocardia humida]
MQRTHTTPATATSPTTPSRLTCAVCAHDWGAHDPIGVRFCSATAARGLARGCVCVDDVALFSAQPR